MRPAPNELIEPYRTTSGTYRISFNGQTLCVTAADARGWDHLSVSLGNRFPTLEEIEHVRALFFGEDEPVMQLHRPGDDGLVFPFAVHLWRPHNEPLPLPPAAAKWHQ